MAQYTVISSVVHQVEAEDEADALAQARALAIHDGQVQSTQILPGHQQFH